MRDLHLSLAVAVLFVLGSGCKKSEAPPPAKNEAAPAVQAPAESPAPPQAATAAPAPTGEAISLKMKWPVGNRYVYRMDLAQHTTNRIPQLPKPMLQDVTMAMTYALSILKELPNDGREAELEFLASEMEIMMGGQALMSFDSKQAGANDAQNPFAGPFRKVLGSKVRLQYDASGKVEQIIGYDEWVKGVQGDANGPVANVIAQQFNEGFIRQVSSFGVGLPEKPVRAGESWPLQLEVPAGPLGTINVENTVTFKGFEKHEQHHCAVLDFAGTLKGSTGHETTGPMGKVSLQDGQVNGSSWFDGELGALIESAQDQVMRLSGEMMAQAKVPGGGVTYSIELGQRVTVKLVELGKTKP